MFMGPSDDHNILRGTITRNGVSGHSRDIGFVSPRVADY